MHAVHAALGLHSMVPVTTAFFLLGTGLAPVLFSLIFGIAAARRFAFAMIPLGAAMWVAHFAFHLFTGWQSIIPVASRILHWTIPGMFSAQIPDWLPAAQILVLDGGLVLSVGIAWNTARRQIGKPGPAFGMLVPWAILAIGIYATAIWILFQPMQMRGMVM